MGAVFKVRHYISQRIEALKIILPQASGASEIGDRFLREIRLLAALQHVNIGGFYNAFRVGDQFAMTIEFIEGMSLREKLKTTQISMAQGLSYGSQILTALAYAHARGVTHRDIKPSNVMIQSDGLVKVLDFGLATSHRDPQITQSGALLGSPLYMSPEQARGERADARSDVYSTGAVLYEMIAGKPPFDLPGAYAVVAAHLHQVPQPPSDLNPNVPTELSTLILKALAMDPKQRFQTAQEFLAALERTGLEQTKTLPLDPVRRIGPAVSADTPSGESSLTQSEIEQTSQHLARYIGPIARIIVNRAAAQSRTLNELYEAVSSEISSPNKRAEFLAKMPAKSISRSAT